MKQRLLLALALGIGLAILVSATMSNRPTRAQGTCDRYVLGIDASDTTDCSDERYPCRTVQYAIDQASNGDVICVARHSLAGPLVYEEKLVITKSITLDGAWDAMCVDPSDLTCSFTAIPCDPGNVTLDALGAGRVISISGNITPTIDCFTITGGNAAGQGGDPGPTVDNDAGGGIYSQDAAPIIIHNVITGNYGCDICPVSYGRGGGIYLLNAPATAVISNNLIANNVADESTWGQGGGIMLRDSDAQVLSNTIEYNRAGHSAGYGGGITVKDGTPTIADNDILHNVGGQSVQGLGGGIFVWSTTPATIERNLIEYNQALNGPGDAGLISRGGGIYYSGNPTVSAVIRDNTIHYNLASPLAPQHGEGGGMYLSGLVTPSLVSENTINDNIAGHNDDGNGGGIYVDDSEATIAGNHLFDNSATWAGDHGEGGGVYVNGGAVLLQSNVITGNFGAGFSGFPSTADGYGGGMAISGSLSLIQNNWIVGNGGTNGVSGAGGAGGGVYGYLGNLRITGNTIADNYTTQGNAGFGGGVYLDQVTSWLDSNTILDNKAIAGLFGRGGGIRLNNCSAFTLTNNIIARNKASELGSGVAIAYSNGQLAHNTIAENLFGDGIGVRVDSAGYDVVLYNNIIVSHTVGISNTNPASTVEAKYTLFEGNGTNYGTGVNSTYEIPGPALLLANYHLSPGSAAIDAGVDAGVTTDIDGDPRPIGLGFDIGADEVCRKIFLPLVLRN